MNQQTIADRIIVTNGLLLLSLFVEIHIKIDIHIQVCVCDSMYIHVNEDD